MDEGTMLEMVARLQVRPIEPFITEKMVEKIRLMQLLENTDTGDGFEQDDDDHPIFKNHKNEEEW